MVAGLYYALLSRDPLESGFDDIRTAARWIDGPPALLQSTGLLSIRRDDGGALSVRKIDLSQDDTSGQYAAALLFRFDLESLESAALIWEVLVAVVLVEGYRYDVWNAAYPARTIAKCAELRPLTLLDIHGYVMRPSEFDCLAERVPE
jgi:hypothetical protein